MKASTANSLKKTVGSALMLALCMVLPLLTGQIPDIGNMLCPMHLPVLLCGLLYGPIYGGAVGFVAPFLRFLIFSAPAIYPRGISMAMELLAYGVISGLMVKLLPKKLPFTYVSLITAQLGGRIVWAAVQMFLTLFGGSPITFAYFMSEAFLLALPGIILQLVILPPAVHALRPAIAIKADSD